jgi:hypothetical protein
VAASADPEAREIRMEMGKRTKRGLIIVLVALSLAGSYVPEWTDHNASDPGITLLAGRYADNDKTLFEY